MKRTKDTTLQLHKNGFPGLYDLKKIWNPSWFQGNRREKNYFEGWYFKMISQAGDHSWAFIPGISLSEGVDHAFVQVINGKTGQSWYFRYPIGAFRYAPDQFMVRIGENYFSRQFVKLELADHESLFSGTVHFDQAVPFKTSLLKPGIMGWYRYMPFMECYHGVVSLNHHTSGTLSINGSDYSFENGKGYTEKDWGRSMPTAWIWMQSNHFDTADTSFMLSIARIPWIGKTFTGFLAYVFCEGKRYDFATYTGARLIIRENSAERLSIQILTKENKLEVFAEKGMSGKLKAPVSGNMHRVIHESIDASIHITLTDKSGRVFLDKTGKNAGLELVGNQDLLKI
jgi:tocopherol cyclase